MHKSVRIIKRERLLHGRTESREHRQEGTEQDVSWTSGSHKKPQEAEEHEDNKHENGMEAATLKTPGRKMSRSTKLEIMKMTTPKKVKTASPCPRMSGRKESPRNRTLKRLTQ